MPVDAPAGETAASSFPPAPPAWRDRPLRSSPPRRRSAARTFGVVVLAALAVVGLNRLGDLVPHLVNPFRTESVDRTGPAVLKALEDLHEYRAATGTFQVLVDVEEDATYLPAFLKGERTLFVASGAVDAGVNFSGLTAKAVEVSPDRRSVTVTLPPARLSTPRIDPQASYVADRDRGLLDRLASVFGDSPTSERPLYLDAEARLTKAAADAGLTQRAEENTRLMLEGLIGSLGFTDVHVRFEPAL